jgi:LAGLIDADG endonuclease
MLQVDRIPAQLGWYLAGFTDGEGCFNVSFRPRGDYSLPWKVSLCFNISQRDPVVLALFKKHLECGTMRQRQDGVWYYEVNNLQPILENVIPFFRRFGFLSAKKKRDFAKFVTLAEMFEAGRHLRRSGIEEILRVRSDMNDGGKRRYTDEMVLGRFEKSSETARQTAPDGERMIQSDLHGNMQSAAEMTAPGEKSPSNNDERS